MPSLGSGTGIDMNVHAYDCDNGMYVVTEQRPEEDSLVLFLPHGSLTLEHREAASGAKYEGGEGVAFWNKGDTALLDLADRGRAHCTENRRRTEIESAKLSGAELWAAGDDPAWSLHLFPERLVLVTDFGETTIQTPTPTPVEDGDTTTYTARTEAHDLNVTLHREACDDAVSGGGFPLRVEVRLDGETLHGCGESLRIEDGAVSRRAASPGSQRTAGGGVPGAGISELRGAL